MQMWWSAQWMGPSPFANTTPCMPKYKMILRSCSQFSSSITISRLRLSVTFTSFGVAFFVEPLGRLIFEPQMRFPALLGRCNDWPVTGWLADDQEGVKAAMSWIQPAASWMIRNQVSCQFFRQDAATEIYVMLCPLDTIGMRKTTVAPFFGIWSNAAKDHWAPHCLIPERFGFR